MDIATIFNRFNMRWPGMARVKNRFMQALITEEVID